MRKVHNPISKRWLRRIGVVLALSVSSTAAFAWSPDGHNAIGMLALDQLRDGTRARLESIAGELDEQAVADACNWPDVIREEQAWEWSKPLHYVNIPRGESAFDEARDCPQGLCATGAIKKYAAELGDPSLGPEKRREAFNWLCHVVADLHQPMHAGFGDDRGGNAVQVKVRGEDMNLHYYWDGALAKHFTGDWQGLYRQLGSTPLEHIAGPWSPADVNGWTEESHRIAGDHAYPQEPAIGEAWEQEAWVIAQQRMRLAAARLALVIETVLGR